MDQNNNLPEEYEPSILDYLKSKIRFWEKPSQLLPSLPMPGSVDSDVSSLDKKPEVPGEIGTKQLTRKPWFLLLALIFAVLAQLSLEPAANRSPVAGIILYSLACICILIALNQKSLTIFEKEPLPGVTLKHTIKNGYLVAGIILAIGSFLLFRNNQFTFINTMTWLISLALVAYAFWERKTHRSQIFDQLKSFAKKQHWQMIFSYWSVAIVLTILLVTFFRLNQLATTPGELISDQAERILAVLDIESGRHPVFSSRNNGSEVLPYYWTELLIRITGQNLSPQAMKIAAAVAGLITLIFVFHLGRELFDRRVGMAAAFFCGIAYWPNVLARSYLGGIFVPLFISALLYFLIRGLKEFDNRLFILAGIALGAGLMSYRVFLVVPFVVLMTFLVYCLHQKEKLQRKQALWGLLIILLISLVIILPLVRVIAIEPRAYFFRIFSRLAEWERPYPDLGWRIFLKNLWAGITMFFWSNGNQWVESVAGRPALDFISGALLFLGIIFSFAIYFLKKNWHYLLLLLIILLLIMPSVLSIAFPEENPSLSQASGAIIPVFIIIGFSFVTFINTIRVKMSGWWGKVISALVGFILVIISMNQNYTIVFQDYKENYLRSSMNSSEIARVISQYAETIGTEDSIWIMSYPHWIDTRLVAIAAGKIGDDFVMSPERLPETLVTRENKMFLLNKQDLAGIEALESLYPEGVSWEYESVFPEKNFSIFFVPPLSGDVN